MDTIAKTISRQPADLAWAVALVLYAACWVLPIFEELIGFHGALIAHEGFWKLITEQKSIDSVSDVFEAIFFAVGWLANELFLLGLVTLRKWPRVSVSLFAFSLGIMISWQIAYPPTIPLLIGYWFWVAAGSIALWLAASRLARETTRGVGRVLARPMPIVLFSAAQLSDV